jgi:hypothetical protein
MSDTKKIENFPVVTSEWNSNIELNIKQIGESCKGYKWMNIQSSKDTGMKYDYLMYATIVIGPLAGVLAAASSPKDEEDCENERTIALRVLIILCGFLSGVLASIIKFSKFEQRSIDHKTAAAKYASLEGNIRRQLSLFREDRVNAGKYLEWISTSFDDLFSASPLIENKVYNEWVEFALKNNIYVPIEYGLLVDVNNDNKLSALSNIGVIKVNNDTSCTDNQLAPTEQGNDVKIIIDEKNGNGSIRKAKRTTMYTSFPELNRYGDGRMEYELSRMFGIKDEKVYI